MTRIDRLAAIAFVLAMLYLAVHAGLALWGSGDLVLAAFVGAFLVLAGARVRVRG